MQQRSTINVMIINIRNQDVIYVKKVGLFGLKCKCENIYCNLHFHAENHNCPYDYKQDYTSNSLGGGQYKKIDKI